MAEYIERDELLKELCTVSAPTPSENWIVEKCIDKVSKLPTADVVPKSEAARWRRNLEAVLEERAETRAELAREIFEEIERVVEDAELEWGTICGVKLCLAELKKKYTESENGRANSEM